MDGLLHEFLTETSANLARVDAELVRFESDPGNAKLLDNIFRLVHSLKGGCGFLGLRRMVAIAHVAESLMDKFRAGAKVTPEAINLILAAVDRMKALLSEVEKYNAEPEGEDDQLLESLERALRDVATAPKVKQVPADSAQSKKQTIRVDAQSFDEIAALAMQLAVTRDQLLAILNRTDTPAFKSPLQKLSDIATRLQAVVLQARLQPLGGIMQSLPRLVRDTAQELGKSITFEMSGEEILLDSRVIDLLKDPIAHIIRNCVAHGIEPGPQRAQAGKAAIGQIKFSAFRDKAFTVVEISDDGRGLDIEAIKRKAVESGLHSPADLASMTEAQIQNLIFQPGLSTADGVTHISGRGVGMDVVREHLRQLDAAIELKSVAGQGTSFVIKIPDMLPVQADHEQAGAAGDDEKLSFILFKTEDGELKALPHLLVSNTVSVDLAQVRIIDGRAYAAYHGGQIPAVNVSAAKTEGVRPMLVFSDAGRPVGLIVDKVVGSAENETAIDIKSGRPGLIGTALFNNAVAEIVDITYYLPRHIAGAA